MRSRTENSVRDTRIRAAMSNIHPQSDNPWPVNRFLTEIAEPESDIIFEVMEKGTRRSLNDLLDFFGLMKVMFFTCVKLLPNSS